MWKPKVDHSGFIYSLSSVIKTKKEWEGSKQGASQSLSHCVITQFNNKPPDGLGSLYPPSVDVKWGKECQKEEENNLLILQCLLLHPLPRFLRRVRGDWITKLQ